MNPNLINYRPMPGRPMPGGPNRPGRPNDDRLIGGFVFPFLLGGVTGAALAPNFWGPRPGYRPYPAPYPYYPPYGPVYYR